MEPSLGVWEPLSPAEVSEVLAGTACDWWIAGGWAIDLHLGRQTRAHADIDVLILRPDQLVIQSRLGGWDLHAADPPGSLRPWREGEVLGTDVHDIWCRRAPGEPWCLQLMIDDVSDGEWVYRRDPRIRRPVAGLAGRASNRDRRVLTPEVQLLQKSAAPRDKDEADFLAAHGTLGPSERRWLRESLSVVSPSHPWLHHL